MENLLIHIGYHKTATTWLQHELFSQCPDVFVPISGRVGGQNGLARAFIYDAQGYLLNSFVDPHVAVQQHLDQLLAHHPVGPSQYGVISHERLSGSPHAGGLDAASIARRLHSAFPKAKVLVMIREQQAWVLSNYFQYLRVGGVKSLDAYLNTPSDGKIPGFAPAHVCYHHLIADYQARFGNDSVCVLPYELFRHDPPQFLQRLGQFVDRDITAQGLQLQKKLNQNRRVWAHYRLRGLSRYTHATSVNGYSARSNALSRPLAKWIRRGASALSTSGMDRKMRERLASEIAGWAAGKFEESNRRTAELIGEDLAAWGYAT